MDVDDGSAEEPRMYRRELPHWRCERAKYFVTWRTEHTQLSPTERSIVVGALKHFHRERYWLLAFVVMNDHVHVLVAPKKGVRLDEILHSWKWFTGRAIRKRRGTPGVVWQSEYYCRVVRDAAEERRETGYIMAKPRKRWQTMSEE